MPRFAHLVLIVVAASLVFGAAPARGQDTQQAITVGGWNVGLDDADINTVAARIAEIDGVDLWGFAEVNRASAARNLEQAAEQGETGDFAAVMGTSGEPIRLVALYDDSRFDLLDWYEIEAINTTGNARAPMVLHLRDTASGVEFLFMVNHLYRSRDAERHKQAQMLNDWAEQQTLPIIAVGDYNFDWDVKSAEGAHDQGYDLMTADGAWKWVQPARLVTTQCSGWPCRYNSVLDFVFAAGPAQKWQAQSEIVVAPGDFPDDTAKSDHRPVLARFWPAGLAVMGTDTTLKPAGEIRATIVPTAPPVPRPPPAATRQLAATPSVPTVGPQQAGNCDPSYPTLCISIGISDLDCRDITARRFPVTGADPHRFDGDGNGIGCERD